MRNYITVLKIAPAFLLAGTMLHAQVQDTATKEKKIEEVVLIGYGKQKKSDLTGSITSITSKDFNGGATSPEQLIQGKTPGVSITGNSGMPGSGSVIRIRGGSSLNANNSPLIVIDGVPQDFSGLSGAADPLSLINPNDIETFDILKDASAAAIYGNRASNGVILITTKKGSAGRLKVDFSTMFSVSSKMGNVDVLDADTFRDYVKNSSVSSFYKSLLGNSDTNWQNLIYQSAWGSDNSVALSGGIKKLPYRLSLGYTEQNGIVKTNDFKRTSLGLNLSPKFLDNHLSVNLNFKGSFTDNQFPADGVIGSAIRFDPTQSVYQNNANYSNYWEWMNTNGTPNTNGTKNPLGLLYGNRKIASVWRALTNLQLDYKFHFLPDLRWNINLGYDYSKGNGSNNAYPNFASTYNNGGSYNEYSQEKKNKLLETYLNYTKKIGAVNLDLIGGYSYQDFKNSVPASTTYFGNTSIVPTSSRDYQSQLTLLSFYGRGIFTIYDKYILTATIRRDGSSRFFNGTRDNVWGNFPSFAFAWKMNEESFLKNVSALNTLKLRLGWGQTGNQEIDGFSGPYPSYGAYNLSASGGQYNFGSEYFYMYRPQQYNPLLTWETTTTKNLGLDFGFLANRITGSLDLFDKTTKDLLADVPIPAGGLSNHNILNVGSIRNKGIEFNLGVTPVKKENTVWDINFNVSHYKPEITTLGQTTNMYQTGGISGGVGNLVQANAVGNKPYVFYVFQQVYDTNGKPLNGVYVDKNNDGILNDKDKYYYKSTTPDATFGFNTKLTHNNWDLGFSLRAVIGNYVYNNAASESALQNIATNSFLQNIYSTGLTYEFQTPQYWSDIFVENASFLRMDNITFGYNFKETFGKNTSLRVYAMGQNVFVLTKYSGVDPEIFGNIDNGFYQRPRVYSVGLNFKF